MGAMSDLHLLATEVLEGDVTLDEQVERSVYPRDQIEWAVAELRDKHRD